MKASKIIVPYLLGIILTLGIYLIYYYIIYLGILFVFGSIVGMIIIILFQK